MKYLIAVIGIINVFNTHGQFKGHSGVYFLGSANIPVSSTNFSNPHINGVVVRFNWNDIETSPGNFNWTFIDGEITKAITHNKKISLQPLGKPSWLASIGAKQYYFTEDNPASPSIGKVSSDIIPWDSIYVNRVKIFLQNLANKYANNSVVSYVNAIGVNFSRNLPDSIIIDTISKIKQAFWIAHKYNADSLGLLMNKMTDYYMSIFPSTPIWCSVDYVTFQPNANGKPINYLASIYCTYGITNYPDRFGLFREDISGCNPNLTNIPTTSHWYLIKQNPCRIGAQMLWSVQDGPSRMNKCGILPNTKSVVLDSAVNKGIALGMRYLEIYGSDITDIALSTSIQQANANLISKGIACTTATSLTNPIVETTFSIYPNPAQNYLHIKHSQNQKVQVQILNARGILIKELDLSQSSQVDISELPNGLYLLRLKNHPQQTRKFIKN